MTTTSTAMTQMIDWLATHEKFFRYTEGAGRLDPDKSKATDCSGLNRYVFKKFFGITIGGYTGDQCRYGTLVTISKADARVGKGMLPGDTLFLRWENRPLGSDPWDHTSIYIGNGKVQNHGGQGPGPVVQSLASNVDNAVAVMVRRNVQPTTTVDVPSVVTHTEETEMLDKNDPVVKEIFTELAALRGQATVYEYDTDKKHPEAANHQNVKLDALTALVEKIAAKVGVS